MGQKNNLVKNASFLMIAAMISKVIGLLYKSPLSSIVGNMGMGYISLAQNAYMILLMIASFSIPQAVSKLISERIALKDYKNAQKIFHGSLIYAAIVGGIVALVCLFGARFIIPSNQPNAILALQILSPTIFLSGILGVYRGYFQAYRNMMPTSISQILEQIFNAAVSLIAAWMFIRYFADGSDGSLAKWGAAGSTVGTTAGVVIALLFMLMVYGVNRRAIRRRVDRDRVHKEESYGEILRLIILIVSPIILSSFIYNINGYLNGVLYSEIMGKHGVDADTISMLYAEYATYFMSIINIPLTLSSAAPTSMIPEVSALYATGDIDETRRRVDQTVQLSMFISIPCAVGLAVLAQPIVSLLFHGTNGVAGQLLMMGSFTILLNGNTTHFTHLTSGTDTLAVTLRSYKGRASVVVLVRGCGEICGNVLKTWKLILLKLKSNCALCRSITLSLSDIDKGSVLCAVLEMSCNICLWSLCSGTKGHIIGYLITGCNDRFSVTV